jgi:hypothetical protein
VDTPKTHSGSIKCSDEEQGLWRPWAVAHGVVVLVPAAAAGAARATETLPHPRRVGSSCPAAALTGLARSFHNQQTPGSCAGRGMAI